MLTEQEKERYNRQVILSEIGVEGQEKMKQARRNHFRRAFCVFIKICLTEFRHFNDGKIAI